MSAGKIERPVVDFDAVAHAYKIEGRDVLGVSTIAKIGGADDAWGIASAWGFRVGYEGAWDFLSGGRRLPSTKDALREELKAHGLTPWAKKDAAAERGSWVHDLLEELGQTGAVPSLDEFRRRHGDEATGHAQSVLRWFLHFRPSFVALEVQVASPEHGFAGRYDVRAKVRARKIIDSGCVDPLRQDAQAVRLRELAERDEWALGLIDLKTSKGVYPTSHFPQLEGYEGAGVAMGFPETDFRAVVNTNADGTFDPATGFAVSWADYEDFLAYLGALRAIRRIKANDPEAIRERRLEQVLAEYLPARSREIAELDVPELAGMDAKAIGRALGKMAKAGKARKGEKGLWLPPGEA